MKKPRAIVTDHAVLRHLERVQGIDVEAVRRELGFKVDAAIEGDTTAPSVPEGFALDDEPGWSESSSGLRYRHLTYRRNH